MSHETAPSKTDREKARIQAEQKVKVVVVGKRKNKKAAPVNLDDVWDPNASDQTHNVVSSVIAAYYREMAAKKNKAVAVAGGTVLGAKHKTLAELEKIKDDAIAKKKEELQVSLERSLAQDGKLAEDASNAGASLP
jgi:hypothetical protein